MGGQRKEYGENECGGEMERSVRVYLRREDCGSCGRWVEAKINIWMQNGKHDMPSKGNAEKKKFACFKDNRENIFCAVKQMHTENQDVIREKCIRGDNGNLPLDETSKKLAWK